MFSEERRRVGVKLAWFAWEFQTDMPPHTATHNSSTSTYNTYVSRQCHPFWVLGGMCCVCLSACGASGRNRTGNSKLKIPEEFLIKTTNLRNQIASFGRMMIKSKLRMQTHARPSFMHALVSTWCSHTTRHTTPCPFHPVYLFGNDRP